MIVPLRPRPAICTSPDQCATNNLLRTASQRSSLPCCFCLFLCRTRTAFLSCMRWLFFFFFCVFFPCLVPLLSADPGTIASFSWLTSRRILRKNFNPRSFTEQKRNLDSTTRSKMRKKRTKQGTKKQESGRRPGRCRPSFFFLANPSPVDIFGWDRQKERKNGAGVFLRPFCPLCHSSPFFWGFRCIFFLPLSQKTDRLNCSGVDNMGIAYIS